ncbi:hypothetical protein GLAREA_10889 [Glarea lozoyensis ATCC 20868]|uniref:DUF7735 domain-containing protein n=1 Tax=Glarea lozoyensis (strain ATCC 20868 / MF5171) TaxID=1116229 RepID=S3EA34_GLAL2|nr:uncharacterized protein GLAREA_10889 [Glarea lozoyensis ATCC 20868]EPE35193.1 hypothetical protein GLAREA_10889 [Glarea lozoyensis ATCC 20868]
MTARLSTLLAATTIFCTTCAWSDSAVYQTVIPTAVPTLSRDPWQCATENITQYFDVPMPTGNLLSALVSYGSTLIQTCSSSVIDDLNCFPSKEKWCAFTTAAPASVLPEYRAYGSAASAWWAAHSSKAVDLAVECPNSWFDASMRFAGGPTMLNETIIFAACYAEVVTTMSSSVSKTTFSASATPPVGVTRSGVTATSTPTATVQPTKSGVNGRNEELGMWMFASTGLAAAAMHSAWN